MIFYLFQTSIELPIVPGSAIQVGFPTWDLAKAHWELSTVVKMTTILKNKSELKPETIMPIHIPSG